MRVRRLPVADRVDRDGACVVLVGSTVVRLSPVATLLLDRCADWTEVDTLEGHLVAELGDPPDGVDAQQAAESTVDALVAQGLLERA